MNTANYSGRIFQYDTGFSTSAAETAAIGSNVAASPHSPRSEQSKLALFAATGEDGDTIQPTLAYLHRNGIGGIVGYSAESDVTAGKRLQADNMSGPSLCAGAGDDIVRQLKLHIRRVVSLLEGRQ